MIEKDNQLLSSLIKKYRHEKVFVVPTHLLSNIKNGFSSISEYNESIISQTIESKGSFMYRYEAEYNPVVQQIIPFIIIINNDENKIYTSFRLKGDIRFNNIYSIGFGGHINTKDLYLDLYIKNNKNISLVDNAANRELTEEVKIYSKSFNKKIIGFVRDLSSNSPEHTGVVYAISLNKVSIKEKDKMLGQWMNIDQLVNKYYSFEPWSRYIIDYLFLQYKDNKSIF